MGSFGEVMVMYETEPTDVSANIGVKQEGR